MKIPDKIVEMITGYPDSIAVPVMGAAVLYCLDRRTVKLNRNQQLVFDVIRRLIDKSISRSEIYKSNIEKRWSDNQHVNPDLNIQLNYNCNTTVIQNSPDPTEDGKIIPAVQATVPAKTREAKRPSPEARKVKYAEFVTMTDHEFSLLVEKFGEVKTWSLISILDNYKGSKGAKYKSDYRAILSWVVKRYDEDYGTNDQRDNVRKQQWRQSVTQFAADTYGDQGQGDSSGADPFSGF